MQDAKGEHSPVNVPYAYAQENIPETHRDITTPDKTRQCMGAFKRYCEQHLPPTTDWNWHVEWQKHPHCLPATRGHLWRTRQATGWEKMSSDGKQLGQSVSTSTYLWSISKSFDHCESGAAVHNLGDVLASQISQSPDRHCHLSSAKHKWRTWCPLNRFAKWCNLT